MGARLDAQAHAKHLAANARNALRDRLLRQRRVPAIAQLESGERRVRLALRVVPEVFRHPHLGIEVRILLTVPLATRRCGYLQHEVRRLAFLPHDIRSAMSVRHAAYHEHVRRHRPFLSVPIDEYVRGHEHVLPPAPMLQQAARALKHDDGLAAAHAQRFVLAFRQAKLVGPSAVKRARRHVRGTVGGQGIARCFNHSSALHALGMLRCLAGRSRLRSAVRLPLEGRLQLGHPRFQAAVVVGQAALVVGQAAVVVCQASLVLGQA